MVKINIPKIVSKDDSIFFAMFRGPGIAPSPIIVRSLATRAPWTPRTHHGPRTLGTITHSKARPHPSRGLLVILDGVSESLGHMVGGLQSLIKCLITWY